MEGGTITIVIADQLALVRDGLAAICEASLPCRIVGRCDNGVAARDLIASAQPDVALLDLDLPGMFALEVIRFLCDSGVRTRHLVLTTVAERETVLEALRSGAQGFLLKSGPARQLIDGIRQVMEGGVYVSPGLSLGHIFVPSHRSSSADRLDLLSAREHQVFSLLVDGVRPKEIANRLALSPKTVDTYRASLMRKLDIHDIAGLVKYAIQRNLTRAVEAGR